jgi:hypothetical protein
VLAATVLLLLLVSAGVGLLVLVLLVLKLAARLQLQRPSRMLAAKPELAPPLCRQSSSTLRSAGRNSAWWWVDMVVAVCGWRETIERLPKKQRMCEE